MSLGSGLGWITVFAQLHVRLASSILGYMGPPCTTGQLVNDASRLLLVNAKPDPEGVLADVLA